MVRASFLHQGSSLAGPKLLGSSRLKNEKQGFSHYLSLSYLLPPLRVCFLVQLPTLLASFSFLLVLVESQDSECPRLGLSCMPWKRAENEKEGERERLFIWLSHVICLLFPLE